MFAGVSHSVYEQQFQMAHFLKQYYNDAPIAANDIGAINFYTNIDCFDLVGLGTLSVARELLAGTYTTETMEEGTRRFGVRIALLYDNWFDGRFFPKPPPSWNKVGEWTLPHPSELGGQTVSFYAAQPVECAPLRANLAAYAPRMPQNNTSC